MAIENVEVGMCWYCREVEGGTQDKLCGCCGIFDRVHVAMYRVQYPDGEVSDIKNKTRAMQEERRWNRILANKPKEKWDEGLDPTACLRE